MRKKHKDTFFKKHGVKLGFMSAFIKASAHALQSEPTVNAGQLVCILVVSYNRRCNYYFITSRPTSEYLIRLCSHFLVSLITGWPYL